MPSFSLRGIDKSVDQALKNKAAHAGISVNALILEYIHKGIGVGPTRRVKHHDLDQLAGTWTDADKEEFFAATKGFEKIDEEFWK
jgi:hypothetical protein